MSGCPGKYSRRRTGRASALAALASAWAGVALAQPTGLPADLMARAEAPGPYPTFASVPPLPRDVRPAAGWRSAILGVQQAGEAVGRQAANEPWTLADSDAWARRAKSEATPPAPITSATDPETEALVAQMRARASAPPRRR